MLVAGFAAGALAANCYVVAAAAGGGCVIVDPGENAAAGIADLVERHRLAPEAVLLTHGHLDHVWSAAEVCATYDVPCWIHPADRRLLSEPLAGLPREWAAQLPPELADGFAEPARVVELSDGCVLELAGLRIDVDHAPGHTGGSVLYRVPSLASEDGVPGLMFAGDVLFAGSIGRTDLPGGDHATMQHTLAARVLPREDRIPVLPGHGDQTTIGRERASNPHLRGLVPRPQ